MKNLYSLLLLTIFSFLISCNQKISKNLRYIDTEKPLLEPKLFAHNFITKDSVSEFGSVFNKKGNEFYFAIDSAGKAKIKYTTIQNGQWIEPVTVISDERYSFNDPFLSPTENKLYYISDKPRNKQDTIKDYDIWYSERTGKEWSKPINAGAEINSDKNEYYISFATEGAMYFASNKESEVDRAHDFDIYKSRLSDKGYLTPQKLSDSVNSKRYEADVFIAPDESYIIFCSARRTGLGKGDLYISFKDETGNWEQAINMGEPINSKNHELCPFVSNDKKYLFYTSNQDIYWVSTDLLELIKEKAANQMKDANH